MPYVELTWNAALPSGLSSGSVYFLKNACNGYYLDINNSGTANGTETLQFGFNGQTTPQCLIFGS